MTNETLLQCEDGQWLMQQKRWLVNFGWVALWLVVTAVWVFFVGPLTMKEIAQFATGPHAYVVTHVWVMVAAFAIIGLLTWLSVALVKYAFHMRSGDSIMSSVLGMVVLPLLAPLFGLALSFLIGATSDTFQSWHALTGR